MIVNDDNKNNNQRWFQAQLALQKLGYAMLYSYFRVFFILASRIYTFDCWHECEPIEVPTVSFEMIVTRVGILL